MPPAFVNETEIRVVGLSRSGNHAIVNWILAQAPGRTCFLNCAEPGCNPFASARPRTSELPGWRAPYAGFEIEAEREGRLTGKDLLIHSYEDTFLGPFRKPENEAHHDEWVGRSRRRIDLLVLRDARNLFASRLASGYGWLEDEVVSRIWAQHAREFLGLRRNLHQERLMVSYNDWVTSRGYRRRVAEAIGLEFDDRAAHKVPAAAGGSSFDGTAYDGRAEQMPVLQRWHEFVGEPRFHRLLTPAVRELSDRIFGPAALPELEPVAA
ncbi:MAG TPA: hypothetical protein VNM38_11930 [Solirubrobacterales bacterium]|nr:hypothetical protein [Solirubrobacterales bacterium]